MEFFSLGDSQRSLIGKFKQALGQVIVFLFNLHSETEKSDMKTQ